MPTILIAEEGFDAHAKKILSAAGRVVDFSSRKNFLKHLPAAGVVVTALDIKFNAALLKKAKKLKVIGSRTTQLRYLDLDECRRRGIAVVNIKADSPVLRNTPSTAEETMALLLALLRNIPWAFSSIQKGEWERKKYGGRELAGKTIGLIGFGRLGKMVAGYSRAFGMSVTACDPYVSAAVMKKFGARKVSVGQLLRTADIVSLHTIYNDRTYRLIQEQHFRLMKPEAVFINTARGEITDERALLKALRQKWIAGAAVDTLAGEMPDGSHLKNNPLVRYARQHQNLLIVPHLGGATREATGRTQAYISELVVAEMKKIWKA